jgi:hypothetical protein
VVCLSGDAGVQLLDAAAAQMGRRIDQFSPADVALAIWAYAKLFHYPVDEQLRVINKCHGCSLWHCGFRCPFLKLARTLVSVDCSVPRAALHGASCVADSSGLGGGVGRCGPWWQAVTAWPLVRL